jgi:drug/metabolite transporter (DMT)-like permease
MPTVRLSKAKQSAGSGTLSTIPGSRLTGVACVLATALGWGLNWPATKFLLTTCPPLSARGVSGIAAGLILFGVAALRGETLSVPRHLWGRLTAAALLNVSAWMGLTTASLLWLPAGQAATFAYTMPVWVVLFSWFLLNERPGIRQITAVVLGICGVLVLVGESGFSVQENLSAALLFAGGTILSKKAPIPLPRIALTAWQVALGCIPLLACGLLFEHARFDQLALIGWIALAYTAVVSMGVCYLLWFAALSRLKPSSAAIGTLLTPVVGVTASSLALGDPFTLSQAISLGLVAAGILLAARN